jgi:succinoglycan biosynthesis protein ExoA
LRLNPFISILIPVRNEADYIKTCLKAVLQQDYPKEKIEILVADGMSDDGTREIIQNYQQEYLNLKIFDNPAKIVPTGLNAALQIAQGDIVIRVDGHTVIAPDYVQQCVEGLKRTGADNIGGRMYAKGEGVFGEAVALATNSPFGVGGGRFHYSDKEEWVDTVYMGAWRREVFEKIGLFDEELVRDQDDEFNCRLRENGGKILLSPKIKSQYTVRGTAHSLFKQYFQYGYWKVRVMQKHPRQMRLRQYVPPTFIGSLILCGILALIHPFGAWLSGGIIGVYILSDLSISIYTSAKKGWKHLPLLPVVYAILHISYGIGFLVGLMKFANRWGDKLGKTPAL